MATVLGFAGLLPIVIWNMQHDWVSFRHVAGQAGVRESHAVNPIGPLEMLAGQLAVVGPVWFVALVIAAVGRVRRNAPVAEERFDPALMRLLVYATWDAVGGFRGVQFHYEGAAELAGAGGAAGRAGADAVAGDGVAACTRKARRRAGVDDRWRGQWCACS